MTNYTLIGIREDLGHGFIWILNPVLVDKTAETFGLYEIVNLEPCTRPSGSILVYLLPYE